MHITQPVHVQPIPFVDPVVAFEAYADDPVAALLDSADAVGGPNHRSVGARDGGTVVGWRVGVSLRWYVHAITSA